MRRLATLLLVALLGGSCGWIGAGPSCEDATRVLATSGEATLTCADVQTVALYIEALAGRGLSDADERQLGRGLIRRFRHDPVATRAQVTEAGQAAGQIAAERGLEAAERRSTLAWADAARVGVFGSAEDKVIDVLDRAVAVWARDDDAKLVLTEVDIEGWIFYASLCREVQDASPLRLSVADRVVVYRDMELRYESLDREGKIAMSAIGAFWPSVQDRWDMASYEEQQEWIAAAPLPPPMVSTSKAYLLAIVEGDVVAHAQVLHRILGPFRLAVFP